MGTCKKDARAELVYRAVERLGTCTVEEAAREVGRLLPTAEAAHAGRRAVKHIQKLRKGTRRLGTGGNPAKASWTPAEVLAKGRRELVSHAMRALFVTGYLERVAPSTYRVTAKPRTPPAAAPGTLAERVYHAVLRLGECTIAQVADAVKDHVSAARAAHRGRTALRERRAREGYALRPHHGSAEQQAVRLGLLMMVGHALKELATRRKVLRRVRKGVYAPPEPKLYNPDSRAV